MKPQESGNAPSLQVDIDSLEDFWRAVENERAAFADLIRPALRVIAEEVPFGKVCGFTEMTYTRPKYHGVQEQGRSTLDALYAAGFQLQAAAQAIAEKYRSSDAFAAVRPLDVTHALGGTGADARPAAPPATGSTT
jgi:hypothetical protein